MKRYCKGFKFSEEFIEQCILDCLGHGYGHDQRWYRKDTSYFLAEYMIKGNFVDDTNLHVVAATVRKEVANDRSWYEENLVPYIAKELLQEIQNRAIVLTPIKYQMRLDSSSLKMRKIGITSIKQQVYDYIAVNACMEMFQAKIGTYQCSSIAGRGQIYAKNAIEKWIRKKHKKARYISKLDIAQFYPSIVHDVLFHFLERDIKNEDVLYLIHTLVDTYSEDEKGLCIGTYLSQYLANYLLSYAYHYIKEKLFVHRKSKRTDDEKLVRLVYAVLFYMDDIALFGSNKKYVKKATHMLINYLKNTLQLNIKHNSYQLIDLFKEGAFLDMVGYRFYKDHTTIRRRVYRKLCKNLKSIRKNGERTDVGVARSLASRHGFVKYSNSSTFKRKSKYNKLFDIARRLISNDTKCNLHGATA